MIVLGVQHAGILSLLIMRTEESRRGRGKSWEGELVGGWGGVVYGRGIWGYGEGWRP